MTGLMDNNRSALIDGAALAYLAKPKKQDGTENISKSDLNADRSNREAMDTGEYQKLS
ncbi:MAG: hypothetical protein ACR2NN_23295 [Bryobacteraceae bacterium]